MREYILTKKVIISIMAEDDIDAREQARAISFSIDLPSKPSIKTNLRLKNKPDKIIPIE